MGSILFIHRSVGRNLIADGELYKHVAEALPNATFSDFDQNVGILQTADSRQTVGWRFPGNDTTPADYAALFSADAQAHHDPTLVAILKFDIIMIKSCYPNSNIASDEQLENIKQDYRAIGAFFAKQPNNKLLILTSPPLIPLRTTSVNAARARQLANWLSKARLADNVFVFDFFDRLAEPSTSRKSNVLKKRYRRWLPFDAHPNPRASREIAPQLTNLLQHITN